MGHLVVGRGAYRQVVLEREWVYCENIRDGQLIVHVLCQSGGNMATWLQSNAHQKIHNAMAMCVYRERKRKRERERTVMIFSSFLVIASIRSTRMKALPCACTIPMVSL